jgi:hypothetical protein
MSGHRWQTLAIHGSQSVPVSQWPSVGTLHGTRTKAHSQPKLKLVLLLADDGEGVEGWRSLAPRRGGDRSIVFGRQLGDQRRIERLVLIAQRTLNRGERGLALLNLLVVEILLPVVGGAARAARFTHLRLNDAVVAVTLFKLACLVRGPCCLLG